MKGNLQGLYSDGPPEIVLHSFLGSHLQPIPTTAAFLNMSGKYLPAGRQIGA